MRAVDRRQQETEPTGFRPGFANASETGIQAAMRSRPARGSQRHVCDPLYIQGQFRG
jgi:hypothetical protein